MPKHILDTRGGEVSAAVVRYFDTFAKLLPAALLESTAVGCSDAHPAAFRRPATSPTRWRQRTLTCRKPTLLGQLMSLFCADRPGQVRGSKLVVAIDNKLLFHDWYPCDRHGPFFAPSASGLSLEVAVGLVSSEENAEVADLARQWESDTYVRVEPAVFEKLWAWSGSGFDMDLMAAQASAHRWIDGGGIYPAHTFAFSRGRVRGHGCIEPGPPFCARFTDVLLRF